MRSKLASGAVGLGVFLIVAAVLVRAYAYPSLAKVPAEYDGITKLESKGAQVFNSDPEVLATETTDLDITSQTIADTGADQPDDVVTWVNSTTVNRADGTTFQQSRERVAFDVVSGAGVVCESCETWIEVADGEQVSTTFEGQIYKFPFGTEKKTYPVWDGATGQAVDARFEGEEKIDGLTVYKFVQRIDPTVVETREVPGSVFGSTESSVEAEMWYEMTRTFYIEPETGSPVNRIENRVQELRYDSVSVSAFTGTVQYTDDQVAELVGDAKSNARMLGGMQMLFPVLMGLLGAILLAAGVFAGRATAGDSKGKRVEDKELTGV